MYCPSPALFFLLLSTGCHALWHSWHSWPLSPHEALSSFGWWVPRVSRPTLLSAHPSPAPCVILPSLCLQFPPTVYTSGSSFSWKFSCLLETPTTVPQALTQSIPRLSSFLSFHFSVKLPLAPTLVNRTAIHPVVWARILRVYSGHRFPHTLWRH